MKRLSFTAEKSRFDIIKDSYVLALASVDGTSGYLMFERTIKENPYDDGIYFEFFQEIASGYNLISECRIYRNKIEVDLIEPFADIFGIDAHLKIDDASFEIILNGIGKVFRGTTENLKMIT